MIKHSTSMKCPTPSTLRLGVIYTNMGGLSIDWYGFFVKRMWWKPWRYSLHILTYKTPDPLSTNNLTKNECIALAKVLGLLEGYE